MKREEEHLPIIMFKKLQNKVAQQVTNREAFKFQFNLSIDYLSDLKEKKKDECTYAVGIPIKLL